eukprot:Phypoly_transcript_05347.p1 GENE.Phypoly_transcript_05347~~Phypoly_transcript_05347.p1  ORF type:complete len:585 (+),score=78.29 Phypoly_transcript_05347:175-1929(+)
MNMPLLKTTYMLFFLLATVHSTKRGFPDTTNGFHWFLVFDTPILLANVSIDAVPYDLVWGASDRIIPMYRASNPNIILSLYIPWARDNDVNQTIDYWNSVHPDWVLYKCDKVTPAYGAGDLHVPLDISNPDVIEWQITKYVNMTKVFGYDGIAADNFALGNSISGCGIWKDGVWIQKYNGVWNDPNYTNDALNWLSQFYSKLQQQAPDVSFGINFSLNGASPTDPTVLAVTEHVDYVVDEAGYTNWGFGLPTPNSWDDISTWIVNIQAQGKHYFGINEFAELTPKAKEFGMASYLMSKNDQSSMVCTIIQGYGSETKMPEYDALNIGSPLGPRASSKGLFTRQYSNGLALANPTTESLTYTLPDDGTTYRDVLGTVYNSGQRVSLSGQTGIVMGVLSRATTTTIATTITTAASTVTSSSPTTTTTTGNGDDITTSGNGVCSSSTIVNADSMTGSFSTGTVDSTTVIFATGSSDSATIGKGDSTGNLASTTGNSASTTRNSASTTVNLASTGGSSSTINKGHDSSSVTTHSPTHSSTHSPTQPPGGSKLDPSSASESEEPSSSTATMCATVFPLYFLLFISVFLV